MPDTLAPLPVEYAATLRDLAAATRSCTLSPRALFVAWHGVLVLVLDGFSPPLQALKESINTKLDLTPENFGSKWPKVTLGALSGERELSAAELELLHATCTSFNNRVASMPPLPLWRLSLASYTRRSLEAPLAVIELPLGGPLANGDTPSTSEAERVASVLSEWDDRQ
eukprot:CAMPEP_0183344898 /NCGR_PEP_ID=MMETSP0164_2-20130417/10474_1 /TAXON_ID=221442 /ORGANISM="Coccolithus pelagicus ssp braarudi, Strain PLY182g" /LENGTH=168 /DNA_ID=CAMNT_0025515977 /DNA_START=67 /DNA_END=570 /DNA_ORIENTATION=-